jgi:hypothetical protein
MNFIHEHSSIHANIFIQKFGSIDVGFHLHLPQFHLCHRVQWSKGTVKQESSKTMV